MLSQLKQPCDEAIVHAATLHKPQVGTHTRQQFVDTNVTGTLNLLEEIRQAQLAEFEMKMHEMGVKGQPITGDALAKLYLDITRRYYGHDQGVVTVDEYIAHEWSYIPHFYRNFYRTG